MVEQATHLPEQTRFECETLGGLAELEYQVDGSRIVFTHTFVPPEARGRGIAEKLVRAGLEYARQARLKPTATCSYVVTFLQRHPEFLET